MAEVIRVKGAREHNLRNVDIEIPRDKLVVITGLSGSGKSSLAFDTIYAEGQRRYMESLNSYARQFLGTMDKPDVDSIEGLSPAISIDQKSTSRNPRSTVATVTEIYDYLRLLFARIGVPHCPVCGNEVTRRTAETIIDEILRQFVDKRILLLAPIVKNKKGEFAHIPEQYQRLGYARVRVDGVVYALDEFPELQKSYKHNIELVVDRLALSGEMRSRLSQSVEQSLELGQGVLEVLEADSGDIKTFSQRYACVDHPDVEIPELEPRLFSFNAPQGACPTCTGLGSRLEIDPELVFNNNLTISEGAIRPYNRMNSDAWNMKRLASVGKVHDFSLRVPVGKLPDDVKQKILYGTGDQKYRVELGGGRHYETTYEGVIPNLERRWRETDSDFVRRDIERFMRERDCYVCKGARLKPAVLAVTVHDLNIVDVCDLSVDDALDLFDKLNLTEQEMSIARLILKEIKSRLTFMSNVGLNYLELSRAANTLSGGEAQRIRLATQIGAGLQGVLYVLDEPSIGLHQRDNDKLIDMLKRLRDLGNSVLVVEHDEDTIRQSDFLVDMGPGAGVNGGRVVATGAPDVVAKNQDSITGRYLSGVEKIAVPKKRRKIMKDRQLVVRGARENNLKNIDVAFPLGLMTVVSGVSGSGKSTLVNDIVARELAARLNRSTTAPGLHKTIDGVNLLDKAIVIDQSPIGRTPRSNPATYTGIFTPIRELFASTPEANVRGYKAGRFSFNVKGGRCEKIKYKDKTIADVLDMTIDQAASFFDSVPNIARKLQTLVEVGLGYIKLGQPATTFSGGEAQRIKLATELSKRSTGKTMYILDEPTTGLHSADVKRLLGILQQLVDGGNSMIIIEHNLDVIKSADWVIDMGPEGGIGGGTVVASGTPEDITKIPESFTGKYLKKML